MLTKTVDRSPSPAPATFDDFWPLYVGQHRDPTNRALHYVGNVWFYGALLTAAITWSPRWALAALLGYVPSWIGHFVVEHNRPATFGHPIWSGAADLRMVLHALMGSMARETTRLYGSAHPAPDAPLLVSREEEAAFQAQMRLAIDPDIVDHPFTDYWQVFVMKHRRPATVAAHLVGVALGYGIPLAALFLRQPRILLLFPLSQLVGLLGHAAFEPSHIDLADAIFSPRASRCLNRMCVRLATGRYWPEVRALEAELARFQGARAPATATLSTPSCS